MPRRPHKKSKRGCVECKRRHIKCDESQPTCLNCSSTERHCSYSILVSRLTGSAAASPQTPKSASPSFERLPVQPSNGSQLPVNMVHLELLHHFSTETFKMEGVNSIPYDIQFQVVTKYAFSAPVLMHEILALAALHLSILRPAQQKFYHHQAQELQTYALSLYNREKADITPENCAPMFLFSALIGTHTLCDTIVFRGDDFNTFLDGFVNFLHLNRGLRAVTGRSWGLLLQTDLKPILEKGGFPEGEPTGRECDTLRELIRAADISPSLFDTFQQVIQNLQQIFDAENSATEPQASISAVMAWSVLLPVEYSELIMQRRPEALVVLAHFGVLLYYHRDLWLLGDGGEYLIRSITKHLGSYWEKWLAWPNEVLAIGRGRIT